MRNRIACCLAVVAQALSFSLFAETRPLAQTGTRDGRTIPSVMETTTSANVAVIVQFREEPLFARERLRATANAADRAAAIQSFDTRFETFARDLARIDHDLAGRVATMSTTSTDTPSRITRRYSRVFAGAAVSVSAGAIARIRQLDYVRSVRLDLPVHAFLENSVPKIKVPAVWAKYGTRGKDVVVAIIDTGIDYNHPAISDGFGPGHRVIGGWDVINNDADPLDDMGHGTHVAGIVGGNGGGIVGVAPEVSFLAFKVLDASGTGSDSTILAGIERAADPNDDGDPADHADVANVSLGRPGTPQDAVSQAVDTASAAGVIFCIAAGNAGAFNSISSPSNAPSAITVGATTLDDEIATFSSMGPVDLTLAIKPEVVAPGVGIVSAKAGGGTLAASGTSMATPHIAGVAALLRAIHRDWPVAHIKAAIVGTAEVLGKDVMSEGAGRVDASRAADADVVAVQGVLSLGRDDVTQTHWTTSQTLTLVNHGSVTRSLTIDAPSTRPQIAIALDATSVTLAPGESRDVHVSFEVDNADLQSPTEGSLAIAGTIAIAGGAMPLHVPWAFVKAALITIDFDGDDPWEAFAANTHSAAFAHAFGDVSQHTATVTVPAGEYDLKLIPFPLHGSGDITRRLYVIERQTVNNTATIAVHRADAVHEIIPAASDERGRLLDEVGRGNGSCQHNIVMMWPEGSGLALASMGKAPYEKFLTTTISDRFTLLVFQRCLDYGNKAAYSAELAPLHGIDSTVTATLDPSEWTRTPVRLAIPAGVVRPAAGLATAWMWHGANWFFMESLGGVDPVIGSIWNGTIFVTREQHATVKPAVFAEVDIDLPDNPAPNPFPVVALRTQPVRRTSDGVVSWPFVASSATTYIAEPGETLSFGEGLFHPETALWTEGTALLASPHYYGALGEDRSVEALGSNLVLRDEAGNVVRSGATFLGQVNITPGRYTFEVVKPIAVRGTSGEAQLVAKIDTTLPDGAPPSLTSLRLLDANGRNVARLAPNAGGSLLFSALDRVPVPEGGAKRGAVRPEATRVQWRAHGATQWNALPATIVAEEIANGQEGFDELGHIPMGTVYRSDLSAVTEAGVPLIDLSLHFEDPSGNSYEWTLSPAFVVDQGSRKRAVRH